MTPSRLDPDELAALEEERDFLLRSLDDLDAELEAGDIDQVDHDALHGDYTRRAAETLRALDEQRAAFAGAQRTTSWPRRVLVLGSVALVAVLAGVLLARSSGFRSPADVSSGSVRQNTLGLLAEAEALTIEGRWEEAVESYDEVLEESPSNVEALTYKGWLTHQLGDTPAGEVSLLDAVDIDPAYPDARVFLAIIYDRTERWFEAADQLRVLDDLDAPDELEGLVAASNLRGQVNGEIATIMANDLFGLFGEGQAVDLSLVDAHPDDIALGAIALDGSGQAPLAVEVFTEVLLADPDNVFALVGKGRRLALDFVDVDADLAAEGRALLDRAVDVDPDNIDALVFRAVGRARAGDLPGATADLELLDASGFPAGLELWVEEVRTFVNSA